MARAPIVAGMFYEASPSACRQAVRDMLDRAELPKKIPDHCVGGLVPHAGWVCSGAVAATTFKALMSQWSGRSILLLGAVHAYSGPLGMLYAHGAWETPLGETVIDDELAHLILERCPDVRENPQAHESEHSLEVQLPFIQVCWPKAKIVPLMVPPSPLAAGIGHQVGDVLASLDSDTLVIGSTDLTHYGPRYGITTAGVGKQGIDWSLANDRRILSLIESMSAYEIISETTEHQNACGGGAIAATISACQALGAKHGTVLKHTNSFETLRDYYPADTDDAVGYASVVFA